MSGKSGNVAIVLFAAMGIAACSAAGSQPDLSSGEDAGRDASVHHDASTDANMPPNMDATTAPDHFVADTSTGEDVIDAGASPTDAGSDAVTSDDGSDDAAAIDAGFDAGFDAALPPTGSPCSPSGSTQSEACGKCGTSTRLCASDGDGGLAWLDWGACQNEATNGCVPGTTAQVACGICGKVTETCLNDCSISVTECVGQVSGGCVPGDIDYSTASCATDTERTRTCSMTCAWGNYDANCSAAPTYLTVSGTVGTTYEITATLPQGTTEPVLPTDACPLTDPDFDTFGPATSYSYVEIRNTLNIPVTVSIWDSKASTMGAKDLATVMAAYPGSTPPADNMSDETARESCINVSSDYCEDTSDPTSCLDSWAGLMAEDFAAISIPALSSIIVYTGGQSASDYGDYELHVRTESID